MRPMFSTQVGKLCHATRVTSITRHEDVELWEVKRVRSLIPSDAMTVGEVVFHVGELSDSTRKHELVHVHQWRKFGSIGFALRYGAQFVWEWVKLAIRGKFRGIVFNAYSNIPLEVEARDARPE